MQVKKVDKIKQQKEQKFTKSSFTTHQIGCLKTT